MSDDILKELNQSLKVVSQRLVALDQTHQAMLFEQRQQRKELDFLNDTIWRSQEKETLLAAFKSLDSVKSDLAKLEEIVRDNQKLNKTLFIGAFTSVIGILLTFLLTNKNPQPARAEELTFREKQSSIVSTGRASTN